jgi:hypothetical protein
MTIRNYPKLAANGILMLVLYIVWILLVMPYLDLWQDRISGIEILQKKHASLSLMIANREMYEQQYQTMTDSRGLQKIFLNNKTGALADVKLQRIIKQAVGKSGGKLLQSLITSRIVGNNSNRSVEAPDSKSVTVNVRMQGSIKSIYSALHQLENSSPLILVSNLEIIDSRSRYHTAGTTGRTYYRARYDATAFIL